MKWYCSHSITRLFDRHHDSRKAFQLYLRHNACYMSLNLSFDNTANAFEYKSDQQLRKAHFLFSSMGIGWLVKLGTRVTPWAIKAGLPIQGIIRKTIFEQFVGGETLEQTARVADKLEEFHVQVIQFVLAAPCSVGEWGLRSLTPVSA